MIVMSYRTPGAFVGLAVNLATTVALSTAGLFTRNKKSHR